MTAGARVPRTPRFLSADGALLLSGNDPRSRRTVASSTSVTVRTLRRPCDRMTRIGRISRSLRASLADHPNCYRPSSCSTGSERLRRCVRDRRCEESVMAHPCQALRPSSGISDHSPIKQTTHHRALRKRRGFAALKHRLSTDSPRGEPYGIPSCTKIFSIWVLDERQPLCTCGAARRFRQINKHQSGAKRPRADRPYVGQPSPTPAHAYQNPGALWMALQVI